MRPSPHPPGLMSLFSLSSSSLFWSYKGGSVAVWIRRNGNHLFIWKINFRLCNELGQELSSLLLFFIFCLHENVLWINVTQERTLANCLDLVELRGGEGSAFNWAPPSPPPVLNTPDVKQSLSCNSRKPH